MAQRIYWAPHTVCFLGCEHCHNDSIMAGVRSPAGSTPPSSRICPAQSRVIGWMKC